MLFWGVNRDRGISGLKEFAKKVCGKVENEVENIKISYILMCWINPWHTFSSANQFIYENVKKKLLAKSIQLWMCSSKALGWINL